MSSLNKIAAGLNSRKLPTFRNSQWGALSVRGMLRNRRYIGLYVSDAHFDDVGAILDGRSRKRRKAEPGRWLLHGLLVCDHCGRKIYGHFSDHETLKNPQFTYGCVRPAEADPNCPRPQINRDRLERFIIRILREKSLLPKGEVDRVALTASIRNAVSRVRFGVKSGKARCRERYGVIQFREPKSHAPLRFDEADLFADQAWRRVAEILRREHREMGLNELCRELKFASPRSLYAPLQRCISEGVARKSSRGSYVWCKPITRAAKSPARRSTKAVAHRARKSESSAAAPAAKSSARKTVNKGGAPRKNDSLRKLHQQMKAADPTIVSKQVAAEAIRQKLVEPGNLEKIAKRIRRAVTSDR